MVTLLKLNFKSKGRCMTLRTQIIDTYLKTGNIDIFRNHWIFYAIEENKYIF